MKAKTQIVMSTNYVIDKVVKFTILWKCSKYH